MKDSTFIRQKTLAVESERENMEELESEVWPNDPTALLFFFYSLSQTWIQQDIVV